MPMILMVEDDLGLCQTVGDTLRHHHFTVETIHDGASVLPWLKTHQYDLIILDWELPGLSGVEISDRFRRAGGHTPILMLTGKRDIEDKGRGFDCGADDYLTKPFDFKELVMRVKALLRRPAERTDGLLRAGDLTIDPEKFRVTKDGQLIDFTRREFQLLEYLVRHRDQIFAAEALLDCVWSMEDDASVNALQTCIARIRKKIDSAGKPSLIQNVYGLGYKLTVSND